MAMNVTKLMTVVVAGAVALFPMWEAGAQAGGEPQVYTVNYPLYYFAKRIGGHRVEVHFPCPEDEDPVYWMPDDETILKYQQADMILLNGAGFAKWVEKVSLPEDKLIDTSEPIGDDLIELEDAVVHSHGPEGKHAHKGTASYTWLDPEFAEKQAASIRDALVQLAPRFRGEFETNFTLLQKDLKALDREFDLMGARPPMLASHPLYHYIARRYAWNLKQLHWEPDEMPTEEEWTALEELMETHEAELMIWEDAPATAIAARLKQAGVNPVVFYPCANRPPEGDYIGVMERNAARIKPFFGVETN